MGPTKVFLKPPALYLAADHPDIQFATKEVCRWMAATTNISEAALKRSARYLKGESRLVYRYPSQKFNHIDEYSGAG